MEVKLPALLGNYDRPTDKSTDQLTDKQAERQGHREVTLPIITQLFTYLKD